MAKKRTRRPDEGRAQAETRSPARFSRRRALAVLATAILLALAFGWVLRRPARPSLLLVTIDTLRADRVGAYGYAGARTPNLDGLARSGALFRHAQSAVPLTGPSHSTILTGLYPPVHGVRDNVVFVLDPRHKTLATRLKAEGYRTAGFVGAYPVAAAFGFAQGFDQFKEGFHESPIPGQGAERPGNEVVDDAIAWLSSVGREPFFLWAHLYDPHAPYTPPAPFADEFRDRPYDGEVAFADAQVGRLLEQLRTQGRDKDTVVAVLADHGESLGEHGEATHAVLVYEATLHVPFLLSGPGVPPGSVVDARVGTVDVARTLLGLAGMEGPAGSTGRDLRRALQGQRPPAEPLYAESLFGRLNCRWSALRTWTDGDWKLVQGSATELFNLARDPTETHSLAEQERERVGKMRQALRTAVQRMAPGGDAARTVAISPEQEQRLRSLGYTAGTGGGGALDDPSLPDPRPRVQVYERLQSLVRVQGAGQDEAARAAVALVASDPGNPFAHQAVASMAYRAGRLVEAQQAFARALELDPDRPSVRGNYGRLLRDMGRFEDSERELRVAVEQTSADDDRTRLSLAETLIALGKSEEAGRLIEGVLAKTPRHPEALGAKGRLLIALGKPDEAIEPLTGATSGGEPDPWIELAHAQILAGRPEKASEAVARALQRSGGHPWALAVAAQAAALQGRKDEALTLVKRALAAPPRRHEAWLALARAYEVLDRPAEAERCRREANIGGGR